MIRIHTYLPTSFAHLDPHHVKTYRASRHGYPDSLKGPIQRLCTRMAGDRNDVDALQPVLDRLAPALEILDGFHHRNKNQHRLSKWWAQLDMLRRATRKLALDLQASIRDRPPSPSQAAKRRKKLKAAAGGGGGGGGGGADERLGLRAGHLRGQLVPRAYL